MLYKIFYLYLINVCAAEDIFESLYKAQTNRATACVQKNARACAGLVWKRHWMLARASCILPYSLDSIYVKRGVVNCSHDNTIPAKIATGDLCSRWVIPCYEHPLYPEVDLALLRLDWPYASELIDNRTINDNILNKLDVWLKSILSSESTKTIKPSSYRNHLKMYSTPMRMFLVTVVLPSTTFVVFFLFIIFFTGKNKGNKIPYRNLNSDKKETTFV